MGISSQRDSISLKEHLERAEYNLLCAKQLAYAQGHRELGREIDRVYREIVIGIEDMLYRTEFNRPRQAVW